MTTYKVEIIQAVTREYTIDAISPESAESAAEAWLSDGEPGTIIDSEVLELEAYPDEASTE